MSLLAVALVLFGAQQAAAMAGVAGHLYEREGFPGEDLEWTVAQENGEVVTTYYIDFTSIVSGKVRSIDEVHLQIKPHSTALKETDFLSMRCRDSSEFILLDTQADGIVAKDVLSDGTLSIIWQRSSLVEKKFNPETDGPNRTWFDDDCWEIRVKGNNPLDLATIKFYLTWHSTLKADHPDLYAPDEKSLLFVDRSHINELGNEGPSTYPVGNSVDATRSKHLIVLIHGWNPAGYGNNYGHPSTCQDSDSIGMAWKDLAERLVEQTDPADETHDRTRLASGWAVARYHWTEDASTGRHGYNEARDAAISHGIRLGVLLKAREVKFVHFVAHSAGTWVARAASAILRKEGGIGVQLTALDPFVNDGVGDRDRRAAGPRDLAIDINLLPNIALTKQLAPDGSLLENYWVDDHLGEAEGCVSGWAPETDMVGYTSGRFENWRTNFDLDQPSPYQNLPCFRSVHGDSHRGPVAWYADTASPSSSDLAGDACSAGPLFARGVGFAGASEAWREPRVKLTFPSAGDEVSGTVSLRASLERGGGITPPASAAYGCDTVTVGQDPLNSAGPFNREFDTRVCSNGLHNIWLRVTDANGRTRKASAPGVRITNSPPPIENRPPAAPRALQQRSSATQAVVPVGGTIQGSSIDLSATLTDPNGNDTLTLEVELSRPGSSSTYSCMSRGTVVSGSTGSARCSSLPTGDWKWKARARDTLGAVSTWVQFGQTPVIADFKVDGGPDPWHDGTVYGAQANDLRLCHYLGGRCRLLASTKIYGYFQPGDPNLTRVKRVPTAEFASLVATSPCWIGGDYRDTTSPGCVHHDEALLGGVKYFVVGAGGRAYRLPQGAVGACFSASRLVEVPGIVSGAGLSVWDEGGTPTYCTPGAAVREDCGDCKIREVSCDPTSCQSSVGYCSDQCEGTTQICLNDQCTSSETGVTPGVFTSPMCDSTVGTGGGRITYQLGYSADGGEVQTGVECRKNQLEYGLYRGFSSAVQAIPMPDLGPDESFECRLRSRRSGYLGLGVASLPCRWITSSDRARMEVREVKWEKPVGIPNACRSLEISAKIKNTGTRAESMRAKAWLHPADGTPESSTAVAARREWAADPMAPGTESDARFDIDLTDRLPLAPGSMAVTVEARDSEGQNPPHRRSISVVDVDEEAPIISYFKVNAFAGTPQGVVAGRTHSVVIQFTDRYSLKDWSLGWKEQNEATWRSLGSGSDDGSGCKLVDEFRGDWSIPAAGFPDGAVLLLRGRVGDRAGRQTEQIQSFVVRSSTEPVVSFRAPVEGARFRQPTFGNSGCNSPNPAEPWGCVDIEVEIVPGEPLLEVRAGMIQDQDGLAQTECRPYNSYSLGQKKKMIALGSSGWIYRAGLSDYAGDRWRVAVQTLDRNHTYCRHLGPHIAVDLPRAPLPWMETRRDPLPTSSSEYSPFRNLRMFNGEILIDEYLTRVDQNGQHYYSANVRHYDPITLARRSQSQLFEESPVPNSWFGFDYYDERLRYAFDLVFPAGECSMWGAEPCDVRFIYEEIQDGVRSQPWEILYEDRTFAPVNSHPRAVGMVRVADGRRLLFVQSYGLGSGHSLEADVFVVGPEGPRRLKTLPIQLSSRLGVDLVDGRPLVYGLVYEGEAGDQTRTVTIQAHHIDPATGEIARPEDVYTGPGMSTWYYKVEGQLGKPRVAVIRADTYQLLIFERDSDGRWAAQLTQDLPRELGESPIAWDVGTNLKFRMSTDGQSLFWQVDTVVMQRFGVVAMGEPIPFLEGFQGPRGTVDGDVVSAFSGWDLGFLFHEDRLFYARSFSWNARTSLVFEVTSPLPQAPNECNDGDLCTTENWDSAAGLCVTTETVVCDDDDNRCNGTPRCKAATGGCEPEPGTAVFCPDDGDLCNGAPSCSASSGACIDGEPVSIDDGLGCTLDACDAASGAVTHLPLDEGCVTDVCAVETCSPRAPESDPNSGCAGAVREIEDDGLACTLEVCDRLSGASLHELLPGTCRANGGCLETGAFHPTNRCMVCAGPGSSGQVDADGFAMVEEGVACDDGRFCTVDDSCGDGICRGTPRDCWSDLGLAEAACAIAGCDEPMGECRLTQLQDDSPCVGGNRCSGVGICVEGVCERDVPLDCNDLDPCTQDACDPRSGCQNIGAPEPRCDESFDRGWLRIFDDGAALKKLSLRMSTDSGLAEEGFGDPIGTDVSYVMCVFDDEDDLVGRWDVGRERGDCAGQSCWRDMAERGYSYKDRNGRVDGVRHVSIRTSSSGQAAVRVEAVEDSLTGHEPKIPGTVRALAGSSEVKVQFMVGQGERCFGANFEGDAILMQTQHFFEARR